MQRCVTSTCLQLPEAWVSWYVVIFFVRARLETWDCTMMLNTTCSAPIDIYIYIYNQKWEQCKCKMTYSLHQLPTIVYVCLHMNGMDGINYNRLHTASDRPPLTARLPHANTRTVAQSYGQCQGYWRRGAVVNVRWCGMPAQLECNFPVETWLGSFILQKEAFATSGTRVFHSISWNGRFRLKVHPTDTAIWSCLVLNHTFWPNLTKPRFDLRLSFVPLEGCATFIRPGHVWLEICVDLHTRHANMEVMACHGSIPSVEAVDGCNIVLSGI